MSKRPKFVRLLPILFGLAANRLTGQDVRLRAGHFGFVNADGSEIIALDSVPYPVAAIDTSALASIVVADHGQLFFHDFPATYRGPAADVWRVDDTGTFSPADFGIPFGGRRGGRFVMALTWAGAEGENAYLLVADSANTLHAVTTSYRYWAPN